MASTAGNSSGPDHDQAGSRRRSGSAGSPAAASRQLTLTTTALSRAAPKTTSRNLDAVVVDQRNPVLGARRPRPTGPRPPPGPGRRTRRSVSARSPHSTAGAVAPSGGVHPHDVRQAADSRPRARYCRRYRRRSAPWRHHTMSGAMPGLPGTGEMPHDTAATLASGSNTGRRVSMAITGNESGSADFVATLKDWLGANWDPDLTVGAWWERLGLSGWAAPGLPETCFGQGPVPGGGGAGPGGHRRVRRPRAPRWPGDDAGGADHRHPAARPTSGSAMSGPSSRAPRPGASCSASRAPARTWPACRPGRSATGTAGWSRGRRCGPRAARWPTWACCWPAPTPTSPSTRASPTSPSICANPEWRCAPCGR